MKMFMFFALLISCGKEPVKAPAPESNAVTANQSEEVGGPQICGEVEECLAECRKIKEQCSVPCWTGSVRTNVSAQRQCLEKCSEDEQVCRAYPADHFAHP